MTDKERAKEYLKDDSKCFICDNEGNLINITKKVQEAFLAGLKAGRETAEADLAAIAYMQGAERYGTKWHNVADGDLPPEYEEVLKDSGTKVMLVKGHWRYVHGDDWEDDASVDHWCEIPIYKGKE